MHQDGPVRQPLLTTHVDQVVQLVHSLIRDSLVVLPFVHLKDHQFVLALAVGNYYLPLPESLLILALSVTRHPDIVPRVEEAFSPVGHALLGPFAFHRGTSDDDQIQLQVPNHLPEVGHCML